MANVTVWKAVVDNTIGPNASKAYGLNGASLDDFYGFSINSANPTQLTLEMTGWGSGVGPLFTVTNHSSEEATFSVVGIAASGSGAADASQLSLTEQ